MKDMRLMHGRSIDYTWILGVDYLLLAWTIKTLYK